MTIKSLRIGPSVPKEEIKSGIVNSGVHNSQMHSLQFCLPHWPRCSFIIDKLYNCRYKPNHTTDIIPNFP